MRGESFAEKPEAPCGASLWLLDVGLVPPPTSRACHRPYISARLPSWSPVGASGGRASTAFPRDSSCFAETAPNPYM